jgi:hypothetical protein
MPPPLSAFIAVLHFSHSRVFNNEINSYPKISVKRPLAYNWRVLSTVEGYCLQLRGTVYSWGVLSTVEVYCLQLRGTVYFWASLSFTVIIVSNLTLQCYKYRQKQPQGSNQVNSKKLDSLIKFEVCWPSFHFIHKCWHQYKYYQSL